MCIKVKKSSITIDYLIYGITHYFTKIKFTFSCKAVVSCIVKSNGLVLKINV